MRVSPHHNNIYSIRYKHRAPEGVINYHYISRPFKRAREEYTVSALCMAGLMCARAHLCRRQRARNVVELSRGARIQGVAYINQFKIVIS